MQTYTCTNPADIKAAIQDCAYTWGIIKYAGCTFKVFGALAHIRQAASGFCDSGAPDNKTRSDLLSEILTFSEKYGVENANL